MQTTSELYRSLISDNRHTFDVSLVIGDTGRLADQQGNTLTIAGTHILIATTAADGGYREGQLISAEMSQTIFSGTSPEVGCCPSATLTCEMIAPAAEIPRMARLAMYVRARVNDTVSEWIPKGVFFIDTREKSQSSGVETLRLVAYDSMLKAEAEFTGGGISWPAADISVVRSIAYNMGVTVDARTVEIMNQAYQVQLPAGYSAREVLGYIAAMYAGSFVISDSNELRLVRMIDLPVQTNYLIDNLGNAITIGGDRILV